MAGKYKLTLNGKKLRMLIMQNYKNISDLSKKANIASHTLYKGLRGLPLTLTTIAKIAIALNVEVDEIIERDEEEQHEQIKNIR